MPTIDVTSESTLTLDQAAALLPPGRNGAHPTLGCMLRWVLDGANAVGPDGKPTGERIRLEAIRMGGRWLTSREALNRFADRLTPRLDGQAPTPDTRSPTKRRRASDHADDELEKAWRDRSPLR
jgi:hypothetical protein